MSSEVNAKFPSMEKTISEQGVDIVVFIVSPIKTQLYTLLYQSLLHLLFSLQII